ncbi:hypothetical protein PV749_10685 [Streptomyces sp. ID03-2B]|uniref:RNase A-like domain-containing protein n=1 Tax=Streptomyces sp. ID03-2B TaxID=3028660 RepID=UPI0029B31F02|nr:RNase A-like domain-containing protein [Streptomyces sp. ID03-2B]MDX3591589.1 hypothetical protein [Streptomyces sp. ID03-2B]
MGLAAAEELGNPHTLDKHVGKTNEQLLQRMRDESRGTGEPRIPGASTYVDIDAAQKSTQYALRDKSSKIDQRLAGDPPEKILEVESGPIPLQGPLAGEAVTGRGVTYCGKRVSGMCDTDRVSLRLMRDPSLDPPYIVFTRYPYERGLDGLRNDA